MAASARQGGERATSFAMACNLLSQYVRKNGAAAVDLGLGINNKVQAEPKTNLPGAEKETMELFPQSAGLGAVKDAAAPDATREQEKQQLTIFYAGKVLVFNDFPADKAKGLMQLASKGKPLLHNVSAPATVTENSTKVQTVVPVLESSLPAAQADDHTPARANTSDMPIARKASLHRFLEKRKDRLHAKAPYQAAPSDASPVKKEPENLGWLGLGPNAALKSNLGSEFSK